MATLKHEEKSVKEKLISFELFNEVYFNLLEGSQDSILDLEVNF